VLRHGPAQDLYADGQGLLPPIPALANLQGDGLPRRGAQGHMPDPPGERVNQLTLLIAPTMGSFVFRVVTLQKDERRRRDAERQESAEDPRLQNTLIQAMVEDCGGGGGSSVSAVEAVPVWWNTSALVSEIEGNDRLRREGFD